MVNAGKSLVEPVGDRADVGDAEAGQAGGVLFHVGRRGSGLPEEVDATGDPALRILGPHLPDQTFLFCDIRSQIGISGFSFSTEGAGGGKLKGRVRPS